MNKINLLLLIAFTFLYITGCGTSASQNTLNYVESTVSQSVVSSESTTNTASEPKKDTTGENNSRVLVAYFSATGNTEKIAKLVAEASNADLFEIVPEKKYTTEDLNYSNDNCRANQEQNDSSARPNITNSIKNIDDYDVVIIGHPIWWGKEPRIIDTFVESYGLSGKTVASFCTSGSSGIETAASNLKALCPKTVNWAGSNRFNSNASIGDVHNWLSTLKLDLAK